MNKLKHFVDDPTNELLKRLHSNERLVIGVAIFLTLIVTVLDAVEDFGQSASAWSIFADLVYMGLMFGLLSYLWIFVPWTINRSHRELQIRLLESHKDIVAWREKASGLIDGLSKMINDQFDQWQLSPAEKQVGALLIKGLSIKQIGQLRQTSDQTVRQQAAALYAKAGLGGRVELSAFFLEDLLSPIQNTKAKA